ncbi:phosphoglycerate mutase [Oleiagrimonas sp.]|jgi:hypothetical protein|uniref:phosphoglycerate mutase n=1 Tax=Oleiagrimonas sp. TaxID=2010330 RepID=UPI0026259DCA|nr:phosphoglycerate mutase [Oleiagrimonas sp.]MDA3914449.1 phosphoglycerate mutase [Oleiagrimonas sp.]
MLHVLLPAFARCGQDPALRPWLIRGDRLADAERGHVAALTGLFQVPGNRLPVAALLREASHGDAGEVPWLCADPAFIQPDMTGARMLACGTLGLSAAEAEALARPLRPLLGDRGFLLETSRPDRWQLRLPMDVRLPRLSPPEAVLGDDLIAHLPEGADSANWRALFNDVQILLHNHPVNIERRSRGQAPVNGLWFWGGGPLPHRVTASVACIYSRDALAQALARRAGIQTAEPIDFMPSPHDTVLLDLESEPDLSAWWPRLARALRHHKSMHLAFSSGERILYHSRHRLRLWRKVT